MSNQIFRHVSPVLRYPEGRDGKCSAQHITIWKSMIVSIVLCCYALEKSHYTWLIVPFADEYTDPIAFSPSPLNEYSDDISICFITSQYSTNSSKTDRIVDVRKVVPNLLQHQSARTNTTMPPRPVTVHFFAYTNLPDLDAPGWEILVRDFPMYERDITKSRWAKFQAFHDPTIRSNCEVVYYVDGIMVPFNHIVPFQKQARRILDQASFETDVVDGDSNNSTTMLSSRDGIVGLAQKLHFPPQRLGHGGHLSQVNHNDGASNVPNRTSSLSSSSSAYTLQKELIRIVQLRKDTEENVNKLQKWLESQPDFSWDCPMIYSNNAFGYAVHSTKFQTAANFLWEHYSKEEDSWRDRPLWCYTLHHFRLKPLTLSGPLFTPDATRYVERGPLLVL